MLPDAIVTELSHCPQLFIDVDSHFASRREVWNQRLKCFLGVRGMVKDAVTYDQVKNTFPKREPVEIGLHDMSIGIMPRIGKGWSHTFREVHADHDRPGADPADRLDLRAKARPSIEDQPPAF